MIRQRFRSGALALALLVSGCGGDEGGSASSTTDRTDIPDELSGSTAEPPGRSPDPDDADEGGLGRFPSVRATVWAEDGTVCELCLLAADTPEARKQGLMHVTDPELDGHDGMVFMTDEPIAGSFWMRNTRIPLTAVFFDGDGVFIDAIDMEPCPDEVADPDCPRYGPDRPFRLAVELAARTPDELAMRTGSELVVTTEPCPEGADGRSAGGGPVGS